MSLENAEFSFKLWQVTKRDEHERNMWFHLFRAAAEGRDNFGEQTIQSSADWLFPKGAEVNYRSTSDLRFNRGVLEQRWISDDGTRHEWRSIPSVG